jgi:hypothetical protein
MVGGYGSPMVSGCCHGNGQCQCGRDDCPCGCDPSLRDYCRNKRKWCKAHTTGDMYPHYAYFPQHHGMYYFRPYNYTTVYEQQAQVMSMGGNPQNPYSVAMFDAIYEQYHEQFPEEFDPPAGSIMPFGSDLPNLEDLLGE